MIIFLKNKLYYYFKMLTMYGMSGTMIISLSFPFDAS
jgi:hypothetical protein